MGILERETDYKWGQKKGRGGAPRYLRSYCLSRRQRSCQFWRFYLFLIREYVMRYEKKEVRKGKACEEAS